IVLHFILGRLGYPRCNQRHHMEDFPAENIEELFRRPGHLRQFNAFSNDRRSQKGERGMTTTSSWTPEFLADIIEALEVSLGRVAADELDPAAASYWRQVQQWLRAAKAPSDGSSQNDGEVTTIPPFPLTGEQLSSLQRAVDHAAQVQVSHNDSSKAQ